MAHPSGAGQFANPFMDASPGTKTSTMPSGWPNDPVMRQVVGHRAVGGQAVSTSQMSRFETEGLATSANRAALADPNGKWIDRCLDRISLVRRRSRRHHDAPRGSLGKDRSTQQGCTDFRNHLFSGSQS